MTDETVVAQSTTEPVAPAEPTTPETPERRREINSKFMDRALRTGRGAPLAESSKPAKDASPTSEDGTDEPKPYTRDELGRFVQAEADRRDAKRAREAQARAKQDEERRLMDEDPLGFTDLKRQEMEQQSTEAKAAQERAAVAEALTTSYDRAVLDPLFSAIPEKEQARLLKEHGHLTGMESRVQMTKGALKAHADYHRAEGAKEAEEKLRKNPAFQKQLLTQFRGTRDEPEIVSAASSNGNQPNMNNFIRAGLGKRTA